jgi:ABC-type amino acid transport system permease subunit
MGFHLSESLLQRAVPDAFPGAWRHRHVAFFAIILGTVLGAFDRFMKIEQKPPGFRARFHLHQHHPGNALVVQLLILYFVCSARWISEGGVACLAFGLNSAGMWRKFRAADFGR